MGVNKPQEVQVMNLVNKILLKGLQEGVAEIHIEPQKDGCYVRFRKDGLLHQACDPISNQIASAMTNCLKTMANQENSEADQPQQGKIQKTFQGKKINFRLSTLPCRYGEKVVLLLYYQDSASYTLEQLIPHKQTLKLVKEMANSSKGLILVTGLPKSGKKTTLYSLLAQQNEYGANISTVENPVECVLPRINQFEVRREKGMDYESIVKYLLEQSTDVLLIDKTQTRELAQIVCYAALSDCLVMTSILHQSDAVSAIASFQKMEVDPSILAEALVGIINQRLIKRICSKCRIPYHLSKAELTRFGKYVGNEEEVTFYKAKILDIPQIESAKTKGTLCPHCQGMGYKGEIAVMEVLPINQRLKSLIAQNADYETLKNTALEEGMISLFAYALELGYLGLTSLEEIEKVFPEEIKSTDTNSKILYPTTRIETLEKLVLQLTREVKKLKHQLQNKNFTNYLNPVETQENLSNFENLHPFKQELKSHSKTLETASDSDAVNRSKKEEEISISDDLISLEPEEKISISDEAISLNLEKNKPKKKITHQQKKPKKPTSKAVIIPDPW